jgi:large subunit ribosomal protein L28
MATTTLLSSSFSTPAAAARRSSAASSLGFATSQLAGLSLGVSFSATGALRPKQQQLQPIVART